METYELSPKIKIFIILGYIWVVIIMIVGLMTIYDNLLKFSEQKIRNEDKSELIIVGNVISKLLEIENSQNLYSEEMAARYFAKHDSILPSIEHNLDSLKTLSTDFMRIRALDSIKILLSEKNKNLKEIAALLDSIQKAPAIEQHTSNTFATRRLNDKVRNFLENNIADQSSVLNDTTVIRGQRKGFFSRIRDAWFGKTDSTLLVEKQPVLKNTVFKLMADTLINIVRYSERLNFERQKEFRQILYLRQAKMTDTNDALSLRITSLLNAIEKEEYGKYMQLLENKATMLMTSQRIIYLASLSASLIAIAFGVVSLVNVNRNLRYRRKLEESNARISDLLDSRKKLMLTISHDIKAPMSSILGYAELMENNLTPQKKGLYLENMRKSGEHILQLVENLLNYHKLESGTWTFKEIDFNVRDIVEITARSFEPAALRKKLEFFVSNDIPKDFSGFGDAYVIRQIMSNMLSNAIKYTSSGSVWMKASLDTQGPACHLLFSVKDTGPGIDEEERKIIFQEFRQLKSECPDFFEEGSGLGLAITSGLVQKLGGELNLESEKGKGSEFSVSLPIKQGEVPLPAEKTEIKIDYDLTGIRILIVDDDPIQLTMASEMLKLKGVRVTTETNPENVMDIVEKSRFDIIFVDAQMPNINGFKLTGMIRESVIAYCKNVPLIILSAKNRFERIAGDDSYTDYLTKPFSSNALYALINKYVPPAQRKSVPAHNPKKESAKGKGVEQLIDFVKDGKPLPLDILNTFIAETSANVGKLQSSIENSDAQTSAALAHKMAPLFKMIGDEHIVEVFGELEKKRHVGKEDIEKAISLIHNYLSEAKQLKHKISVS